MSCICSSAHNPHNSYVYILGHQDLRKYLDNAPKHASMWKKIPVSTQCRIEMFIYYVNQRIKTKIKKNMKKCIIDRENINIFFSHNFDNIVGMFKNETQLEELPHYITEFLKCVRTDILMEINNIKSLKIKESDDEDYDEFYKRCYC